MSKPANTPKPADKAPKADPAKADPAKAAKREGRTEQEMKDRATEPDWYGVTSF